MNNLVIICNENFRAFSTKEFPEQQADMPFPNPRILYRRIETFPQWRILVYNEPPKEQSGHFIDNYLEHISEEVKGTDCDRIAVFFHFTRILESPPTDRLSQRKYAEYEGRLRSLSGISKDTNVLVCGFHREIGLWDVIKELRDYIDGIEPSQSNNIDLTGENTPSDAAKAYDSSQLIQSYMEKIDRTLATLFPAEDVNRFDAAIELLQIFLPLDIELQLESGNNYVERCRETATKLIRQASLMENLVNRITEKESNMLQSSYRQGDVSHQLTCTTALGALKGLLSLANRIQTANREELIEIFGFRPENGAEKLKDGNLNLNENGFHKLYEALRDNILVLV